MNTWTKQMGHPVVFVNTTSKTNITLTQQQFLLNPNVKPNEISDYELVSNIINSYIILYK